MSTASDPDLPEPVATAGDVRVELDTSLGREDIHDVLDRSARMIYRHYAADDFVDDDHRRDFEAAVTALRIASGRDRKLERTSLGSATKEYETAVIDGLRARVRRLDPGQLFSAGGVRRRTGRYVRTADPDPEHERRHARDPHGSGTDTDATR